MSSSGDFSSSTGIVVAGGGITGLATAIALLKSTRQKVTILEAEDRIATHQTGHNSGVIHSGLYYKPGSLKAELCRRGREALVAYCTDRNLPHEICGKLVVATTPEEIPRLDDLERRGRANGLRNLRRLQAEEIKDYEPNAAGLAALHVPETGIVDFPAVAEAYKEDIETLGGEVFTSARLMGVTMKGSELVIETRRGAITCRALINCCGLQVDRIARLCGAAPGIRIIPFRGEYYDLVPEKSSLVKNLIYPVPDPQYPFLGVHFTRKIGGGIEAGPNAVLAFKREGYTKTSFSPRDVLATLSAPGFSAFTRQHWKAGLSEFRRSFSKHLFVTALQKLVPALGKRDVFPAGCGVRAQAMDASGHLLDDFAFLDSDRMIHVLNAPSPAATASLAIGEAIAARAVRNFELQER